MESFIEFVCRLRVVQFEPTTSDMQLKKCVFVFCILIKLQSVPHLMETWTVFFPYFSLANLIVISHVSLFEADIAHPGAEHALLQPPRPSVWWSSSCLPWTRQYTMCGRGGEQDHITGLLDAVHYVLSELQQVIPERTRQGTKPFQSRHDAFPAEVLHLACASGEEPQLPPLSSWLTTLPPGLESMCQQLHAQPTLARSETCSMECPLLSWTTSTYCSPNGSVYRASYIQGASGRPSKAASFIRVSLKVARSCISLRKQTTNLLDAPLV